MLKKVVCGLFAAVVSLNVLAAETFFCYEKLECPTDNNFSACQRVGEKAGIWSSATPVIVGSLKKGTHIFKGAFHQDRSRFPGTCDYGSVVLNSGERLFAHALPGSASGWSMTSRSKMACASSNPQECAFIKY